MTAVRINWGKIAPSLLAIIIDTMGFGLVYPLMTAILANPDSGLIPLGASEQLKDFYLGLAFLLYPLCMFFGASYMGDLSDMLGRKNVLLICMGGICISFLFMAMGIFTSSLFLLLLGRALSGLMAGSQPIAQASVCDLSTEDTKAMNMTIVTLTQSLGIVIGPVIGGVFSDSTLSSFFNYATPFLIAAILSGIDLMWITFVFEETHALPNKQIFHWLRPIFVFIKAFKLPRIRLLAIVFLLMQIGFSIYFQLILVLLSRKYHYSSMKLGLFNAFVGLSFGIGLLFIMRIALKYWKASSITIVALLFTAISQICAALLYSETAIWILALPTAAFDMVAFTGMLTAFSDASSKASQGWILGVAGSMMALSWTLSGFSTNLITFLGLETLILIGGIFLFLSCVLMVGYTRKYPASADV